MTNASTKTRSAHVEGGTLAVRLPDHLPPQSLEAEQAALGAALISTTAVRVMLDMLDRDDLYLEAHRRIFDAIDYLAARGTPTDSLTLTDEMRRRGHLDAIGGVAYVNALWESVPTAAHARHYCNTVREKSALRKLIEGHQQDIDAAYHQELETEAIIAEAEARLAQVRHKLIPAKGPEVLSLSELLLREFAPPAWIVPDLLPVGVCMLAGPPKSKKSFFVLGLALALAAGGVALGKIPVEQVGCLCVFLEDRFAEVKERAIQLLNGAAPPQGLDIVEQAPRMDEGGEVWLDKYLTEHPACRFVALDPLVRVRGGRRRQAQGRGGNSYDDDYEDLEAFKRLTDRHGICLEILHHTRKMAADDWLQTLNGSTAIPGAADAIMALQSERGDMTATLRATGRRVRDREDLLSWDDHTGWTLLGPAEQASRTREQDDVVQVLREAGHPMRFSALVAAVCEATGKREDAIKKRVSRMADQGRILKDGSLYFLPSPKTANSSSGDMGTQGTGGTRGDIGDTVQRLSEVPDQNGVSCHSPEHGDMGTQGTGGTRGDIGDSNSRPEPDDLTFAADLDLPADQDSPDLRQRCYRLAGVRGYPEVRLTDGETDAAVPSGREAWAQFCRKADPGWLTLALAMLAESTP